MIKSARAAFHRSLHVRRRLIAFTTSPPNFPSDAPQRIIFGSCSDSREDLSYWDTMLSLKPDVVLLMGDNVYGKSSTLKEEYQLLQNHPSFQQAKKELCILATVDDNDYYDNNPNDADGGNGCTVTARADAAQLFCDTFQPTLASSDGGGLYQSYQWGNDLQIILLDVRTFASPLLPTDEPGALGKQYHIPDYENKDKTMLGDAQWEWLEEKLTSSSPPPAKVTILVSPQQVMATGHGFECWHMLPYERQRLLSLLHASRADVDDDDDDDDDDTTVLLLSGDRHVSALYEHTHDEKSASRILYEITSSSLTHAVPQGLLDSEQDDHRVTDFCYSNNFGMLDVINGKVPTATIHHATTGKVLQEYKLMRD